MVVQHPHGGSPRRAPAVLESRFQTVRISKGRHHSPARGACVMELASLLAGERFDDHPQSVCPVIAGFLRGYNDLLPDGQHDELYPYAALVVGTTGPRRVRRARARALLAWADGGRRPARRRRFFVRLQTWDIIALPAVEAAVRLDPPCRRVAVAALLDDLCALGRPPDRRPSPRPGDTGAAIGSDRRAPVAASAC
jgi:hypothetical protein